MKLFLSFILMGWTYMLLGQSTWQASDDPSWKLVFNDEFDSTAMNANFWNSGYPWNQKSYVLTDTNDDEIEDTLFYPQLAYITWDFENFHLHDGIVTIEALEEPYVGKVWDRTYIDSTTGEEKILDEYYPYNYTTGLLWGRHSYRYYYTEMAVRFPKAEKNSFGMSFNFYTFGTSPTVSTSEIDIFETTTWTLDNSSYYYWNTSNTHFNYRGQPKDSAKHDPFSSDIYYDGQFHTYGCLWTPDSIIIYRDGKLLRSSRNHPDEMCAQNMFIDIGVPGLNFGRRFGNSTMGFPAYMDIDYVRVWQKENHCNEEVFPCSFDPQFCNKVYSSVTAGNGFCTHQIPLEQNHGYYGVNGVTLNAGFEVPVGTIFVADAPDCIDFVHTQLPDRDIPGLKAAFEQRLNTITR